MRPVCYGNARPCRSQVPYRHHHRLPHWAQSFQIPCRQWRRFWLLLGGDLKLTFWFQIGLALWSETTLRLDFHLILRWAVQDGLEHQFVNPVCWLLCPQHPDARLWSRPWQSEDPWLVSLWECSPMLLPMAHEQTSQDVSLPSDAWCDLPWHWLRLRKDCLFLLHRRAVFLFLLACDVWIHEPWFARCLACDVLMWPSVTHWFRVRTDQNFLSARSSLCWYVVESQVLF